MGARCGGEAQSEVRLAGDSEQGGTEEVKVRDGVVRRKPDDDVDDDLAPLSARLRRTSIKPAVRGGMLDLGDGLPSDDESLANSNDSTEVNDNLVLAL